MKRIMCTSTFFITLVFGAFVCALAGPLPDTGQTKCYDNSAEIACPEAGEDFYGQDASYLINPPSYTKLDAEGSDLPDSATEWVMVRDNVTGLIWEVKTDDGSIHDRDNTYTWYDSNPETNGGNPGTPGDETDTEDFIDALNTANFGGFSDWRLPTVKELASIVNWGRHTPAIDTDYFSNTVGSDYWSSTTFASVPANVWNVYFSPGSVNPKSKGNRVYVRCVRGGQTGSFDHLVFNDDGTVTDTSTGLLWQQATTGAMEWKAALSHVEALSLGGHDDWRLPNIKELLSIANYQRYYPSIDTDYFPDAVSSPYWASSTFAFFTDWAWAVNFSIGRVWYYNKDTHNYVRCVRGGQNRVLGHLVILAPAQGSRWDIGSSIPITWETQNIPGNVKISLSRQGGKDGTFETIAESTANDRSYDWTVMGSVSVNCVLKIEPINNTSKGTTQGLFNIYNVPTVSTGSATSVTANSATLNGTVNPNGSSTTYYFEYGTTTSYGSTTTSTSAGTGTSDVSVNASLTGLTSNTTYHFRLVATNSAGTSYGSDQTFTTSASTPIVTTGSATSVSSDSATLHGMVNPNGLSTTYYFDYGTTTSYGSTTTSTSVGSGTSNVAAIASLTALSPSTTYHFRIKATNSAGTTYGDDQIFTTSAPPVTAPTVTTGSATSVTASSATLNGTVNPNGSSTTYYFEYGTTTSYGSTTSSESAGSGSSDVSVTANLTGLSASITYHYLLVATNNGGTTYGSDQTFTTSAPKPTLSIGLGAGTRGETITLPITLSNVAGTDIAAVSVDIGYDTSVFEKPKATIGPAGDAADKTISTSEPSFGVFRVTVFSISNNNVIGDGVVAYLTLDILSNAPGSSAELTNTPSASDPSGNDVAVEGTDGTVTLLGYLAGDCNGDGTVSIAEVQSAINMALDIIPVEDCVDVNGNGKVSISEVQKVINNHMELSPTDYTAFPRYNADNARADIVSGRIKARAGNTVPTLTISRTTGEPGETVTVSVSLTNASGYEISALLTNITYDTNVLENPTVEIGPAGTAAGKTVASSEPSSGIFRIGVLSVSNNSAIGNGVVAYLTFTVKTGASLGVTTLQNSPEASDPSGNDVLIERANGSISAETVIYVEPNGECGGKNPCFSTIQDGIDSADTYSVIKVFEGTYDEDITVDQVNNVTIQGGWDSTFTTQSSNTVINSLTITGTSGPVEIENIVLQ